MDKKKLEKFITYIVEVANRDGNEWFRKELFYALGEDKEKEIPSFESFFRLLKLQLKLKAKNLYISIPNSKLKKQLVHDCLNMYWYQVNNDVINQFNFTFFQFENLLNYYISNSNSFNKIEVNKNHYVYTKDSFSVVCYDKFFLKGSEKDIKNISIWAKLVFWSIDTDNLTYLVDNHSNFSNLINIRNDNIHKNSANIKPQNQSIDYIKKGDFTFFGFYINILKTITSTLNDIKTTVVKYDYVPTKVVIEGPKVVGKVDLDKIRK